MYSWNVGSHSGKLCPTGPFTILKPEDQERGEFYVVKERRATDLEAPELWKGRSGS